MKDYELGQAVRLRASFANAAGAKTDPTTVTFRRAVISAQPPPDPTASEHVHGTDGAVVKDSTGEYHYDFTPSAPGVYVYTAQGTGTVAAVRRGKFRVLPSPFA